MMNCKVCKKSVYEPAGSFEINEYGYLVFVDRYSITSKQAIELEICSFCGDTRFQSGEYLLSELKNLALQASGN